jgi:uncharacterized alkaline shock family protein YloU
LLVYWGYNCYIDLEGVVWMSDNLRPAGKTTIAPDVLVSIARLATLGIEDVKRLSTSHHEVGAFFRKPDQEGVVIRVENNRVYADIHVVLNRDVKVREVCHNIQNQVARSISEMVGMEVGKINIHVEDIEYNSGES